MTDTIRKRREARARSDAERHEARARYDVALAKWQALDAAKPCRACHDIGLINHEDAAPPCPMCRPDEAREAARGATP